MRDREDRYLRFAILIIEQFLDIEIYPLKPQCKVRRRQKCIELCCKFEALLLWIELLQR